MDDAQLVLAALGGDTAALAAIYDRYADRIHDFAASTVRNRADAAVVTHETFLVAFERLDQLRQPERLKSWIYAIAHHAALKRIAARRQLSKPEELSEALFAPTAPEERLSRAELAEFIWMAAAHLSDRDLALLDLHLRQGLEDADLADAVGITANHLPVVLDRLRAQTERSLGALLVARTGRRSCPQLAEILARSPGPLTPELWDRITRHVDDCEICNSRRRIALSPLDLLAITPAVPAPASLRQVVLDTATAQAGQAGTAQAGQAGTAQAGQAGTAQAGLAGAAQAGLAGAAGWLFTRDGFPYKGGDTQVDPTAGPKPVDPGATTAIAATTAPPAASAIPVTTVQPRRPVLPAGTRTPSAGNQPTRAYSASPPTTYRPPPTPPPPPDRGDRYPDRDRDRNRDRDRRGLVIGALAGLIIMIGGVTAFVATRNRSPSTPVSVASPTTVTTNAPPPASTTSRTTIVSTTTPVSSSVAPGPGRLVVGAAGIDFGVTGASQSLVVGNSGGSTISYTATPSSPLVTVMPAGGPIDAGMSLTLNVTLDRATAPTGKFSGTMVIASEGGSATVAVTGIVDPGPTVSAEAATPPVIFKTPCALGSSTSTIMATVNGPFALKTVTLHWQSPTGTSGSVTMASSSGSTYSGPLGPFPTSGTAQWWIAAADAAGVTTMSSHHPMTVTLC